MIKRDKIDLSMERRILSNLIMNSELLGACRSVGKPSLFESALSRIVAAWVWDFFDRLGEAPGETISDIYRSKVSELQEADAELVYDYLSNLSAEWNPTNVVLAKDMALKYFRERALATLSEDVARALKSGDITQGERLVAEYTEPTFRVASSVSIGSDTRAVQRAFSEEEEALFAFPRELGKVIGGITREDFLAFLAPPKRGKTWWLISTAITAYLQGRQVLFISLEMSEAQMVRRFWQYLSGGSRYGEKAPWPTFIETGKNEYELEDREFSTTRVSTESEAIEKIQDNLSRLSRGGRLELRNWPTGMLSVNQLRSELKNMEVYENFTPEVVVLDYADIMDGGKIAEERHRLNGIWLGLRGLQLEKKFSLISASQTGRKTVEGTKDASESDIAEDIRKMAHCTKMATINQTKDERKRGLYRIACNTTRDGAVVADQVVCTSCLAIGRPFLETKFLSQVTLGGDYE